MRTEGVKHPVFGPEKLEECADYILDQFSEMGLHPKEHKFRIEGFDYEFRNIEAATGSSSHSELLIVSHYDTVRKAPGANDNGTAISVMLEAARVLSETDVKSVRFISFTLEEGNPKRQMEQLKLFRKIGFFDEKMRFADLRSRGLIRRYNGAVDKARAEGTMGKTCLVAGLEAISDDLRPSELNAFQEYLDGLDPDKMESGLEGSRRWVERAVEEKREVAGLLCLETIGYTSEEPNSQTFPKGISSEMFQTYGTDDSLTTGDFLAVIADKNSGPLAKTFCDSCRHRKVELPYSMLQVPMGFEEIKRAAPDLLRSDHAPFWKAGIPGLMLTDTANFRYPFYHTEADTIDKLDFGFLKKVCQSTLLTALSHSPTQ